MSDEMPLRLVLGYGLPVLLALAGALWWWVVRDSPRRKLQRLRDRQEEQHRRRQERLTAPTGEQGETASGSAD